MHAEDIKTGYLFLCSALLWPFELIVVEESRKCSLTRALSFLGRKILVVGFDVLTLLVSNFGAHHLMFFFFLRKSFNVFSLV